MPDAREFELISVFFKVFGDATRAKILWALHERELCGCDLAELLSMSKSAISHQLSYLRQNRLVSARRSGKSVFYSLADDHIKNILEVGREHINE
jgi:ArsR family transcriptional regulator